MTTTRGAGSLILKMVAVENGIFYSPMDPIGHAPIRLPPGVIKIKAGYNPNSSSIGTVLYTFPYAVVVIGTVAAIVALFLKQRKKSPERTLR